MVSTVLLILAPVLIGVIIFGTTVLLSPGKKPNVNDTHLGNITTTAQFITTVLIPDKVATTVSLAFTTPPTVVTIPSIVASVTTKETGPPATTSKTLPQKPGKEGPSPSSSPSKSKPDATTADEAAVVTSLSLQPIPSTITTIENPTPTKPGITIFPGIIISNPFNLFKPAEPPKSTAAFTTTTIPTAAVVAPATTTTAKDVPTTTTTIAKELSTTTKATTTTTTTVATPTHAKSGIIIFPGITIPNPFDLFKPAEPPKPTTTTADAGASTTTLAKEILKPTVTTTMTTTTRVTSTTTTTTTSPTITKSGITIFPGVTLPNPFDLFKPADPPKPITKTVAAAAPTTTTAAKEVSTVTTTTTVAATIASSPLPTKRPGFALFPGISLPNPFDLFPHGHPGGETRSPSHRLHLNKPDDITKEKEHVEIEDHDYIDDERDAQNQDKADADDDWEDEEIQQKGPIKTGSPQKALRQRSLKRVRGHHHHRRSTQKAQHVRRQKLSLHDVIQIARNATVSPPVKTLHLVSGSSTRTMTVATNPIIPLHPVVYRDRKDIVIKDTDFKSEEKLSTPLQSLPVSNSESVPPSSSQGAQEPETKDPVLQELESVIDKLVEAQTESFEESLNLIVNNLILSDEMESYQDLLFESITVSKLEIPEGSDGDSTLDFDTHDQVDTLYSFRTSYPPSFAHNPVFQGPRAVSRFSILTSILNAFLPPFILRFRADLRNFLFWICSRNASAHIDGKDASGDDTWAKKVAQDDINTLIHPDGSIDLKSIWDPRVGALALDCIKSHAQVFWNEVSSLVGTRFTQIKEFLVGQVKGLIGQPQFFGSSILDEKAMIDLPDQQQEEKEQQQQEEQVAKAQRQGMDTVADLDIAGEYTQMGETEFSFSSASAITIAQEKTSSSPVHPNQRRKPSPASDQAQNLRVIQRTEATSDEADGFVKWFVDTVVNELQDNYFTDAKVSAVSRVETQSSGNENDGIREAGERICAWVKERVENVLQ
ncbi:hypothetical protein BGZ90_002394 [Linnemannia elongata]|nr:hypothetical protein BGZ90_002394 [Linnemannia elongata]